MNDVNYPLFVAPRGVQTLWLTAENPRGEKGAGGQANGGRKGAPAIKNVLPGSQHVLADINGTSGVLRRIWMTINDRRPKMLRGFRIDIYWDGAARPAVSAPLGDFFGHMLGKLVTFDSAMLSSPEGRSFNCCFPMPFRKGVKVVVTNETDEPIEMLFYEINCTVGDAIGDDALYFHSHWRREAHTVMQRDYEILPTTHGRGRYLGTAIGVISNMNTYNRSWWGEGEVKFFIDGDTAHPTLCGTGTEDYIGTAWGQGRYDNLYQGCHLVDDVKFWYGFYRLHVPDPVFFSTDIRATIHQIGCWDPISKAQFHLSETPIYKTGPERNRVDFSKKGNTLPYDIYEREDDDWSSCAYFYLDRPENNLPALASLAERLEKML